MRIKDYSTLKSASKISLSKDGDIFKLTQKRYDSNTGEAIADNVSEIDLEMYKNDKAHKENEKALLETEIAELGKIITDIEAL
tara:strand:- start:935 stop:1183 length:249 start_codon:yes stop_codon:yes gene_type:complete